MSHKKIMRSKGNLSATSSASALSRYWREGDKVVDRLKRGLIPEGTVIATFINGRYPNHAHGNHAAIFVRAVSGGIEIFDQWSHHKPSKRTIRFGQSGNVSMVDRAESYSVVE